MPRFRKGGPAHPAVQTSSAVTPGQVRHVPELDGLRGIAILLVIVHHSWTSESSSFLDSLAYNLSRFGWIGVEWFFVLSGFLITGVLLRTRGTAGYFRIFYVRRVLRIVPLYSVLLVFLFLIGPRFLALYLDAATIDDAFWYWCFLSNLAISRHSEWPPHGLAVTWSLAVEEQFYLIWPTVVAVLSRSRLVALSIVLVIAAIIWRVAGVLAAHGYISTYTALLSQMDSLALGAFVALLWHADKLSVLHRWTPLAISGSIVGLVAIGVLNGSFYEDTVPMQLIGYSLVGLVGAAFLATALVRVQRRQSVAVVSWPVVRALGRYSYCIYLIHVPVNELLRRLIGGLIEQPIVGSYAAGNLVELLVLLPVLMACGAMSWRFVEQPFLGVKRHFAYSRAGEVSQHDGRGRVEGSATAPVWVGPQRSSLGREHLRVALASWPQPRDRIVASIRPARSQPRSLRS